MRWLVIYLKGETNSESTKPEDYGKEEKWSKRIDTALYLKLLRKKTGKYLEVYVDSDFSGNWEKYESLDRDTARYKHGYIFMYAECNLVWKFQL